MITLGLWGIILFLVFCWSIYNVFYLVMDMLRFHVQNFQLFWCHDISNYIRNQLYHLASLHNFLASPWHFVIRIIIPISRNFYFITLMGSTFHGIILLKVKMLTNLDLICSHIFKSTYFLNNTRLCKMCRSPLLVSCSSIGCVI
jgi:hypothetical protein